MVPVVKPIRTGDKHLYVVCGLKTRRKDGRAQTPRSTERDGSEPGRRACDLQVRRAGAPPEAPSAWK